jgi:hypothetical protein
VNDFLDFLGVAALFLIIFGYAAVKERLRLRRQKAGLPPRQPMDFPPLSGSSYKPTGVTAVTQTGIRVRVSCPHRGGHKTPELAVACGEREKNRIESS